MTILYEDDVLPTSDRSKYQGLTIKEIAKKDPRYLLLFQRDSKRYAISDEVINKLRIKDDEV